MIVATTNIKGLPLFIRGKVRDVYDLDPHLLIITTDRISAYDCILPTPIPDKGRVLNQLSAYWFEEVQNIVSSHFITIELDAIQTELRLRGVRVPDALLSGRSMLVNRARGLPVECVVRGYLDGSAWREYQETGSVCGQKLPAGLERGSRLPEPLFTPARKNQEGHDENITIDQMREGIDPGHADRIIQYSLEVYGYAAEVARSRGFILADTKFEFGLFQGEAVLIDECLTPDSSRYYDARLWRPGGAQVSFDKQYVRDWLDQSGWDHTPPAPPLAPDVVQRTSARYRELFDRLTQRVLVE